MIHEIPLNPNNKPATTEKKEFPPTIAELLSELKLHSPDGTQTEIESVDQLRQHLVEISLEDSYNSIYENRKKRQLDGEEGVIGRTIGLYDEELETVELTFTDSRRNKTVDSELKELQDYINKYDKDPLDEYEVGIYLETADIMFQNVGLKFRKDLPEDKIAATKQLFTFVLSLIVRPKLEDRKLDYILAKRLGRIKYGIRALLEQYGYNGKHPELEDQLCLDEMKSWKAIQDAQMPEVILAEIGQDSFDSYLETIFNGPSLDKLVRNKYGHPLSEELDAYREDFRPIRDLTGKDSVFHRVFGAESPVDQPSNKRRDSDGIVRDTDIGQYQEALIGYEARKSQENLIALLKKAASFVWQLEIVTNLHTKSAEKGYLTWILNQQIELHNKDLKSLGINPELVPIVTKIVFGSRSHVERQVKLEDELIRTYLEKRTAQIIKTDDQSPTSN